MASLWRINGEASFERRPRPYLRPPSNKDIEINMKSGSRRRNQACRAAVGSTALLFLISSLTVDASNNIHQRIVTSHPLSTQRNTRSISAAPIPFAIIRGGSESASAWNAGSRYDYRSPKYSSSRSQSTRQPSYPVTAEDDTREGAKEAIATAFLNREDRNRFIGEFLQ